MEEMCFVHSKDVALHAVVSRDATRADRTNMIAAKASPIQAQ